MANNCENPRAACLPSSQKSHETPEERPLSRIKCCNACKLKAELSSAGMNMRFDEGHCML